MLAGMLLLGRAPAPPLSDYINAVWYAAAWKPPHARERHMPDGSMNLIIVLDEGGGGAGGAGIVDGARSEATILETARPITVIGVHFRRGGATPFLEMPASELSNTSAPIDDVCGRPARALRDRVLEQKTPEGRMDVLEQWLAARLMQRRRLPEPAILWAARQLEGRPQITVRDVAAHIGRSSRWFINRFADDMGLTPKVFGRVQRFQRALRRLHRAAEPDLAELAVSTGYFDQPHLTHEFRSIGGLTPSQYLASRTGFLNHVALGD